MPSMPCLSNAPFSPLLFPIRAARSPRDLAVRDRRRPDIRRRLENEVDARRLAGDLRCSGATAHKTRHGVRADGAPFLWSDVAAFWA